MCQDPRALGQRKRCLRTAASLVHPVGSPQALITLCCPLGGITSVCLHFAVFLVSLVALPRCAAGWERRNNDGNSKPWLTWLTKQWPNQLNLARMAAKIRAIYKTSRGFRQGLLQGAPFKTASQIIENIQVTQQ